MSAVRSIAIAGCLALVGGAGSAFAHGGGLNAEGCHTNRKTGEYHCHSHPAARAALGRPGAPEPDRPKDTVSCYDFIGDWRAAQDFFDKSGLGDPFRLDGDGDGVACEILKWYDAPDPGHGDRDCAYFDGSWRKAQDFYEAHQPGDEHHLDADHDGIACEVLLKNEEDYEELRERGLLPPSP